MKAQFGEGAPNAERISFSVADETATTGYKTFLANPLGLNASGEQDEHDPIETMYVLA